MEIQIKCMTDEYVELDELQRFQGHLKSLDPDVFKKLRISILKHGFIAPFFVWNDRGRNNILDGHQRLKVLLQLRREGYDIPPLPVVYIEADDRDDARSKLLAISSQYGEYNLGELAGWMDETTVEYFNAFNIDTDIFKPEDARPERYVPTLPDRDVPPPPNQTSEDRIKQMQDLIERNNIDGKGTSIIICPYCGTEQLYERND